MIFLYDALIDSVRIINTEEETITAHCEALYNHPTYSLINEKNSREIFYFFGEIDTNVIAEELG